MPLPWKLQGRLFHLRGGVLPPIQPLIEENSEPSEENLEFDQDPPPPLPMEEVGVPRSIGFMKK